MLKFFGFKQYTEYIHIYLLLLFHSYIMLIGDQQEIAFTFVLLMMNQRKKMTFKVTKLWWIGSEFEFKIEKIMWEFSN